MASQFSPPIKATCKFRKDDGELCRRNVATGEDKCWQHASSFRHRLKSLTGNQTLAFLGMLLGLAIGALGLYLSYIGRHVVSNPPLEKPYTPPASMREFFKRDFPTMLKVTETHVLSTKRFSQEVDYQIYVDLASKAVFVGYFVPSSPHFVEICSYLADEPGRTIADQEKKISISGGYVGRRKIPE
jgi:hypothetical protein